jgi:D-alanine-D-alanine ligase-like ATP-grasp enzyme
MPDKVSYHTPPRFPPEATRRVRDGAARLFRELGLRDCARVDGWYLEDGRVVFTDVNIVSGMEQTSFLFQQAAQVRKGETSLDRRLGRGAGKFSVVLVRGVGALFHRWGCRTRRCCGTW